MAWLLVGGFGLLGLCVALLLPPFHLPDERRHWLSAHLRAERITGGSEICSQNVALERHFRLKIHFRPERKVPPGTWEGVSELVPVCESKPQNRFSNAFSYPGVLLVRWLGPEPETGPQALLGFRVARVLSGALLLALVARAAWLARASPDGPPPGLLVLLAVPLSPLFVQQSFGITVDVVVNGSALALAIWLAFGARVSRWDLAAVVVLCLPTAFSKPVLIPVLPAALLLGLWLEERDASDASPGLVEGLLRGLRRRPVFAIALVAVVVAGLAFAAANPGTTYRREPIDGAAQLVFVRENPLTALRVMAGGLLKVVLHPTSLLSPLGYLDTPMRWPTQLAFGGVLAVAIAGEGLGRSWRARPWSSAAGWLVGLFGLAVATSLGAIAFSMYLMATPVGSDTLYGLQPRYLLAHVLLAVGAAAGLLRGRLPVTGPSSRTALVLTLLLAALVTALAVSTSLDLIDRYV